MLGPGKTNRVYALYDDDIHICLVNMTDVCNVARRNSQIFRDLTKETPGLCQPRRISSGKEVDIFAETKSLNCSILHIQVFYFNDNLLPHILECR